MACILSMHSWLHCPSNATSTSIISTNKTTTIHFLRPKTPSFYSINLPCLGSTHRRYHVVCSSRQQRQPLQQPTCVSHGEDVLARGSRRREALLSLAFFTSFTSPKFASTALAESDNNRVYIDDANKFQISIPQDWQVGTGDPNKFKSVTAFYPGDASSTNVSVVITGLGPDFTRMESFGKVEEFAETLVGGLDRSWQRPPGVAAKLVDCRASKGFYYIEYTLQNPGESRRHLYSALGMASNGWYNRLYTVTGQYVDEDSEKYGSQIRKVVSSFQFV